jgi:hypothetical protein
MPPVWPSSQFHASHWVSEDLVGSLETQCGEAIVSEIRP